MNSCTWHRSGPHVSGPDRVLADIYRADDPSGVALLRGEWRTSIFLSSIPRKGIFKRSRASRLGDLQRKLDELEAQQQTKELVSRVTKPLHKVRLLRAAVRTCAGTPITLVSATTFRTTVLPAPTVARSPTFLAGQNTGVTTEPSGHHRQRMMYRNGNEVLGCLELQTTEGALG
jgi:hypothetical protein